MKYILSICAFLFAFDAVAQARALSKALADSPRAYALFDDAGKPVAWPELVKSAQRPMWCCLGSTTTTPSCTGFRRKRSVNCWLQMSVLHLAQRCSSRTINWW